MPLAIQAIERYGRTEAFSFTHYLNVLPLTEQTIDWVIAELQGDFQGPPEQRHFYYLDLSRLLCRADIRLVAPHAAAILEAAHFDPKERPAFRERLEMFEWSADRCWHELLRYCEANKDTNNTEEFDLGHALRIVEALARQSHQYEGQIVVVLSEEVHDFRHDARKWLQPLLAKLAGDMRSQAAVVPLVGNPGHPYSFLSDQCVFALAKIGSAEVVGAVCDRFRCASRDFRSYAGDLLCKIHLDVCVHKVLELLSGESDFMIRWLLCQALLDHFSSEGIETARELIRSHELTPDLRRFRVTLIATCKIMGARFPEFDAWHEDAKKDAREERKQTQEILRMAFEAGGGLGFLIRKMKAQIAELKSQKEKLGAEIAEKERAVARKSLPRPNAALPHGRKARADWSSRKPNRIGRNDPCRCGSGKKFKHGCLIAKEASLP
jgi:hypothetical protein